MYLNLRIIDSASLKPVRNCKVEVSCQNYNSSHRCDGKVLVGLPNFCEDISIKIDAPMYYGIKYNVTKTIKEHVVSLDFIEMLSEDSITA